MSAVEIANTEVIQSHHSVAMDNYSESEEGKEEVGMSEKPLTRLEKSLFALLSG